MMRIHVIALCALLASLDSGESASAQVSASAGSGESAPDQLWQPLKNQAPEEIARGQTDFWARTLRLSAEQAAALQQINLRYASNLSLVAKASSGDETQKLATMESYEAQKTEEVLDVLTPAQRDRYLAFEEKMNQMLKAHAK
jgi:hypothetical protein